MNATHVNIVNGPSADALLGNDQFHALWRNLYEECPHATAFQAPGFVSAWYGAYRDQWQPVIVQSKDSSGCLIGLWLLAYNPKTNVLSHAGTHQAEYHVWLTKPGMDASFLSAAWTELKRCFAFTTLRLKYLPSSQLGETLQSAIGMENRVVVRLHNRPLLVLNNNDIQASFAKKSNKSRFNRLNKLGKLEFRRLTDPAELERIFDEVIEYYDFRQGAVNQTTPFRDDPHKRKFHTDLFAIAEGEVYVTAAYLDGLPIAAFWVTVSGKMVHLGMVIHSPFLAEHSPGKLHIMQLSEHLLNEGMEVLDLTPGSDPWKERFANAHDKVAEAIIYRSRWKGIQTGMRDVLFKWAKLSVARTRIAPNRLRSTIDLLRRVRPSSVARKIRGWVSLDREYRVYRADRILANKYHYDERVHLNSLHDLLSFEPSESWQTRDNFLSNALARLEQGESVYTVCIDNHLAHYGWMVDQTESHMPVVKQSMKFLPDCVSLYDFYSNPEFRGRGLYQATLGHMLCLAFSNEKTHYAYIMVLADNLPSRHVIEKMGFEYQCSFYLQRRFGKEMKWESPLLAEGDGASE